MGKVIFSVCLSVHPGEGGYLPCSGVSTLARYQGYYLGRGGVTTLARYRWAYLPWLGVLTLVVRCADLSRVGTPSTPLARVGTPPPPGQISTANICCLLLVKRSFSYKKVKDSSTFKNEVRSLYEINVFSRVCHSVHIWWSRLYYIVGWWTPIRQGLLQFRKFYINSFHFIRTVWWRLSCAIGYLWRFMQLQLTSLSLANTRGTHRFTGPRLNRNYTVIPLIHHLPVLLCHWIKVFIQTQIWYFWQFCTKLALRDFKKVEQHWPSLV